MEVSCLRGGGLLDPPPHGIVGVFGNQRAGGGLHPGKSTLGVVDLAGNGAVVVDLGRVARLVVLVTLAGTGLQPVVNIVAPSPRCQIIMGAVAVGVVVPALGLLGAGRLDEALQFVVLIGDSLMLGATLGDVAALVVAVLVIQQRVAPRVLGEDAGGAHQGVIVDLPAAAAVVAESAGPVPLVLGVVEAAQPRDGDALQAVALPEVFDQGGVRAGVALLVARRVVAVVVGQAEGAVVGGLLDLAVVGVVLVAGAEAAVVIAGEVASIVVAVGEGALGQGFSRLEVALLDQPVGGVVVVLGDPAVGVGGADQVTGIVVDVGDELAAGAGLTDLLVPLVVAVPGGVAVGVGDRDQVVAVVVPEQGALALRVDDLDQPVKGVVTVLGDAPLGVDGPGLVARRVVLGAADLPVIVQVVDGAGPAVALVVVVGLQEAGILDAVEQPRIPGIALLSPTRLVAVAIAHGGGVAGGIGLLDQPAFRVVVQGLTVAQGVDAGLEPPARTVAEGGVHPQVLGVAQGGVHQLQAAAELVFHAGHLIQGVGDPGAQVADIIAVLGGVGVGIGDRDRIAHLVVTDGGGVVQAVGAAELAARQVVAVVAAVVVGIGPGEQIASGVVGIGGDLSLRIGHGDHIAPVIVAVAGDGGGAIGIPQAFAFDALTAVVVAVFGDTLLGSADGFGHFLQIAPVVVLVAGDAAQFVYLFGDLGSGEIILVADLATIRVGDLFEVVEQVVMAHCFEAPAVGAGSCVQLAVLQHHIGIDVIHRGADQLPLAIVPALGDPVIGIGLADVVAFLGLIVVVVVAGADALGIQLTEQAAGGAVVDGAGAALGIGAGGHAAIGVGIGPAVAKNVDHLGQLAVGVAVFHGGAVFIADEPQLPPGIVFVAEHQVAQMVMHSAAASFTIELNADLDGVAVAIGEDAAVGVVVDPVAPAVAPLKAVGGAFDQIAATEAEVAVAGVEGLVAVAVAFDRLDLAALGVLL